MSSSSLRSRRATSIPSRRGEPEVEHDDVGQERVHVVERLHAVAGELDLVALEAQGALQDLRDVLVVLDDEHADGTGGGLHAQRTTAPLQRAYRARCRYLDGA